MSAVDHPHAARDAVEQDAGAAEAQALVDAIAEGRLEPRFAWTAFAEMQSRHGRGAPALRAFLVRLAKAARKANTSPTEGSAA